MARSGKVPELLWKEAMRRPVWQVHSDGQEVQKAAGADEAGPGSDRLMEPGNDRLARGHMARLSAVLSIGYRRKRPPGQAAVFG